ncbi:hypothetical protein D8674_018923 [Pyrus ussuriensis x Pyrus communis]|uniref:Uncharacterized protein n=1 Tax=Pyrus ussuriensis x Pyrus communis TaxID=2448454 RepID=A0A5N5GAW0_9ROSA|nr:hypothetical protein D8674_018923 [Pyrus ussuriensis x Pyrus communis]
MFLAVIRCGVHGRGVRVLPLRLGIEAPDHAGITDSCGPSGFFEAQHPSRVHQHVCHRQPRHSLFRHRGKPQLSLATCQQPLRRGALPSNVEDHKPAQGSPLDAAQFGLLDPEHQIGLQTH